MLWQVFMPIGCDVILVRLVEHQSDDVDIPALNPEISQDFSAVLNVLGRPVLCLLI